MPDKADVVVGNVVNKPTDILFHKCGIHFPDGAPTDNMKTETGRSYQLALISGLELLFRKGGGALFDSGLFKT